MEGKKGKQNGELGKSKKQEKTQMESHREYLDMNTDEEEFGLQETPEPEEEAPPEPERPVFTDEQLNTLVQYVKDIAILPGLSNSHWNDDCVSIICEYFGDPSKTILTLYLDKNRLTALLDFPTETDNGLVYVLRSPWQIYNVENFLKTVIFGTMNESVENTIFRFLENIYAPIAFKSTEWSELNRNNVFSSLNDFLTFAMRQIYRPMSLTILYIPREGFNLQRADLTPNNNKGNDNDIQTNQQTNINKEEFIGRLERVVRTWMQQISEALTVLPYSDSHLKDVKDEFDYWQAKYDNLSYLKCQLKNENVLRIIDIFEDAKSSSVMEFRPLCTRLQLSFEEAASNLIYLNLILDACKMLQTPKDMKEFMPKILLTLRFVWLESPFYNSSYKWQNIQALLKALSVHVMNLCRASVNLEDVFHGEASKTKEELNECLECCKSYSEIYDGILEECLESGEDWNISKNAIFACIKAFTQRCNDVLEICHAAFFFHSGNKLHFGGPRGKQHEIYYERIEGSFYQAMKNIEDPCKRALDVTNYQWLENMQIFRQQVSDLENLVKNLIDEMFESMRNVEYGIEMLYALQKFSLQSSFHQILCQKWTMVWKIFEEELKLSSPTLTESMHSEWPCNIKYLTRQYVMLIDASDWIGDCEFQRDIIKRYKTVLSRFHAEKQKHLQP